MNRDMNEYLKPPRGETLSFLQARDPSILGYNRPLFDIKNIRHNLANDFPSESDESEEATFPIEREKEDEGLSVHLRIKGGVPYYDLYSIEGNTLVCVVPEGSCAAKNHRENTIAMKKFRFSTIFGPDSSQEEIFNTVIKNKILLFINGNNSTLLAYGASGSGKTFTMVGSADNPGIIPRSLDYLFRTIENSTSTNLEPRIKPLPNGTTQMLTGAESAYELEKLQSILQDPQQFPDRMQHTKTYKEMQGRLSSNKVAIVNTFPPFVGVWVSFAEIYNENIYDLLKPLPGRNQQRVKLKIGGLQDETYIRGLTYVYVRSGLEAYQVLHYGLHNLSYAATAVNQHSSRSHCIFSIRLVAGYDQKKCQVSVFNFCDLAGSERLKKTMNAGDRLKESTKINMSLSVLGRCISSIRDKQQNSRDGCSAPFRETKLTQLFQKSLQGKEDISMIVNINPSLDMFDDTQHALTFSAIAKQIVTQEAPLKIFKPNRFSSRRQNISHLEESEEDGIDKENRALRDQVASLLLSLSELRQQSEQDLASERHHLKTTYEAMLNIKDEIILEYSNDLEELKRAKEECDKERMRLQRELRKKPDVIIVSSDESSDGEEEKTRRVLWQKYRNEIDTLRRIHEQQLEDMRVEQQELKNELHKSREATRELEETLNDANADFNKLSEEWQHTREKLNELTIKNISLEDKVNQLEGEVLWYREHAIEQRNEIDKLEEQNDTLLQSTLQLVEDSIPNSEAS